MRAVIAVFIVVLTLGATAAFAQTRSATAMDDPGGASKPFSTSYALVIGIDKYSALPALSEAVADADAVGAALKDGGFQSVQVERDLSSDRLEEVIEDFIYDKGSDPDARLLIWFSGHGHTINGEGYLAPADAPDPAKDEPKFLRRSLPLASFARYMNEVKARHVIAVFDTCFSGSVFNTNAASAPASVGKSTTQFARQYIASGSAGEVAMDDGAFRKAFIDAIQGKAKGALSSDGFLTGARLGRYLAETISIASKGKQNPVYSTSNVVGLDRGDFVFPASFPTGGDIIAVPMVQDLGKRLSDRPPVELRIEKVEAFPPDDPQARILADKLARQLVEFYAINKIYVSSGLTGRDPPKPPTHFINARVSGLGDDVSFDVDLTKADGSLVASASFAGGKKFFNDYYRVLPQTVRYLLDVSLLDFEPLHTVNRPTESGDAYALFLAARQRASRNQFDLAESLLNDALETDDRFTVAYAGLAQLALKSGNNALHDELMARARGIDADFSAMSIFSQEQLGDPVPALRQAAVAAAWEQVSPGLEQRRIEAQDYGTSVFAWRYDPAVLKLALVKAQTAQGETAAEMRTRKSAVLAMNAGFFDLDMQSRQSPVGMIVVDGRQINPFDSEKARGPLSGLLTTKDGKVSVALSRDYQGDGQFDSAVQSGPLVVDPGGKNGIRSNSFDRQNRSVVCLEPDGRPILIQVSGGLSLYEVGELLSTGIADGGFGCERALNLDGGPSSQVSVRGDKSSLEIPGLWKISSSLVLTPN